MFRSWLEIRINVRCCNGTKQLAASVTLCAYHYFFPWSYYLISSFSFPVSRAEPQQELTAVRVTRPSSRQPDWPWSWVDLLHTCSPSHPTAWPGVYLMLHPLLSAQNTQILGLELFWAAGIAQSGWHKGWRGGCSSPDTFTSFSSFRCAGGCSL